MKPGTWILLKDNIKPLSIRSYAGPDLGSKLIAIFGECVSLKDALLIAAAPELLAACEALVAWGSYKRDDFAVVSDMVKAAIAQATGQPTRGPAPAGEIQPAARPAD